MSEYYPGKFISLDVKFFNGCDPSIWDANILYKYYHSEYQVIANLINKYGMIDKTLIESELTDFLDLLAELPENYHEYYSVFDDFDAGVIKALRNNYAGISLKIEFPDLITEDHIKLVHLKGLRIQLWTTNDSSQLSQTLLLKPDFIQSEVHR